MTNRFNTFVIGVIVVLVLMLVNITGRAYYQQWQRHRSGEALIRAAHVPVVSGCIFGLGR